MANPRRRLRSGEELSAAEWRWLSGEKRRDYRDGSLDDWLFAELEHGGVSRYRFDAKTLLEEYGELVSPARRRVLRRKIAKIDPRRWAENKTFIDACAARQAARGR